MLYAKILPGTPEGSVTAPPSKSYAHRAFLAAALASGESIVENAGTNRDVLVTLEAVRKLGAEVKFSGEVAYISGFGGKPTPKQPIIDCGESGSTLRFLAPVLAMAGGGVLTGAQSLLERPMQVYEELFSVHGSFCQKTKDGYKIGGPLQGGSYTLVGNVSSQFITGLLFALPLAGQDSVLQVQPPFESKNYVDMTLQVLADFGISIIRKDEYTFAIPGGQSYRPGNYTVEGDWSSAAFFAVLGALRGKISCTGLKNDSLQADRNILQIVADFGAKVSLLPDGFTVEADDLMGQKLDISNCPDLGPVVMCLGVLSHGCTTINGASRLAYKESNRLEAMANELRKIGGSVADDGKTVDITGGFSSCSDVIDSHNDHRVVMSMAIAGAVLDSGIVIKNANVCDKSYPEFFEDLNALGIRVRMRHISENGTF